MYLDKCIVKYIIIDNSVQNEYHRAENSILPAGAWNAKTFTNDSL
jgi:hypothetical protein